MPTHVKNVMWIKRNLKSILGILIYNTLYFIADFIVPSNKRYARLRVTNLSIFVCMFIVDI